MLKRWRQHLPKDMHKGQRGRLSTRTRSTKAGGNLATGGGGEEGESFFLWRYWFDGCLAEAPKAVPAWILACHLGQGH